jgi:hypothetical protein
MRDPRWRAGRWLHHEVPARRESAGETYRPPGAGERAAPSTDDAARSVAPPLSLRPAAQNPILAASDLGPDVAFVADPFLWIDDDWHLFVEVYRPSRDPPAALAHLSSEDRGGTWRYTGVVLEPDVHVAFPFVFEHEGERFMLPDPWSERPGVPADFTLYCARTFPDEWEPVATPLSPARELHDCVLFRREGRWWALAGADDELWAFHSAELVADDWTPHADNPVVTGRPSAVRPGGRPIVREGSVIVCFQDCSRHYGERLWAYEVTELTPDSYSDEPASSTPVLEPTGGLGWNSGRMHHMDAWLLEDRWLCAVDGNVGFGKPVFGDHWAVGLYEQPLSESHQSGL